jgi:5'-deoxynucleotidase YfbR-like HD superfamily hydrolase
MIGAVAVGALSGYLSSALTRLLARLSRILGRSWWPKMRKRRSRPSAWHAGAVMRWHTHRHLAGSGDRVDGHSARVAILILQFFPRARPELIKWALIHDLGEYATGDIASPAKRANPGLYAQFADLEETAIVALGFELDELMPYEKKLLALADGFDAYLWGLHHAPAYVGGSDAWRAMLSGLRQLARELDASAKFDEILKGVSDVKN